MLIYPVWQAQTRAVRQRHRPGCFLSQGYIAFCPNITPLRASKRSECPQGLPRYRFFPGRLINQRYCASCTGFHYPDQAGADPNETPRVFRPGCAPRERYVRTKPCHRNRSIHAPIQIFKRRGGGDQQRKTVCKAHRRTYRSIMRICPACVRIMEINKPDPAFKLFA